MPRTRINISSGYLFLRTNYRQASNGNINEDGEYAICSTAITLPTKSIQYVEYNLHLYLSNSEYSEFECDLTQDGDVVLLFGGSYLLNNSGTWLDDPPTNDASIYIGKTACFMFNWSTLFDKLQYSGESIESSSVSGYIDVFWKETTTVDLSRYDLNVLSPNHEAGDFINKLLMDPNEPQEFYVGSAPVKSIFKGRTKVYGSGDLKYFYNFYRHEQLHFDEMASRQYVNGVEIGQDWTYIKTITPTVTIVTGMIRQVEFDVYAVEDGGDYVGIRLSSPDEKFSVSSNTTIRITWDGVLTITRV